MVTEAVRVGLEGAFVVDAMPAEEVKGITERVVTYAVRDRAVAHAAPA